MSKLKVTDLLYVVIWLWSALWIKVEQNNCKCRWEILLDQHGRNHETESAPGRIQPHTSLTWSTIKRNQKSSHFSPVIVTQYLRYYQIREWIDRIIQFYQAVCVLIKDPCEATCLLDVITTPVHECISRILVNYIFQ